MTAWQQRADAGDGVDMRGALPLDSTADEIAIETQLLLVNLMARLQRVVTAGGDDRRFLRDVRGMQPALLSEKQRKHVIRLAWRYRFQIPAGLRPGNDPDKTTEPETN